MQRCIPWEHTFATDFAIPGWEMKLSIFELMGCQTGILSAGL